MGLGIRLGLHMKVGIFISIGLIKRLGIGLGTEKIFSCCPFGGYVLWKPYTPSFDNDQLTTAWVMFGDKCIKRVHCTIFLSEVSIK